MNFSIAMVLILQVTALFATFVVPSFRDTTIRTRITRGVQTPRVETLRLKGPRGRSESMGGSTGTALITRIWQCDQREFITLREFNKTYEIFPILNLDESAEARKNREPEPVPLTNRQGPVVTITTDSQDTGERRQMAGYELKHLKTTVTVDPAEGAGIAASKTDVDGWYVDLPGLNCSVHEQGLQPPVSGWLVRTAFGTHDTFKYVRTGNAVMGYTVEETATVRSEGNVVINKTELLEFSDQPLAESLFEVPMGYTENAHPVIQKRFSLAKPNN